MLFGHCCHLDVERQSSGGAAAEGGGAATARAPLIERMMSPDLKPGVVFSLFVDSEESGGP